MVKATSSRSRVLLRAYFNRHPLRSSKFLDYVSWCVADALMGQRNHRAHYDTYVALSRTMNRHRQAYTWDHLDHWRVL